MLSGVRLLFSKCRQIGTSVVPTSFKGLTLFLKGLIMKRISQIGIFSLVAMILASGRLALAQQVTTTRPPSTSQAEATLEQAATEGKYTFLVFYKTNDEA
ncbi:MAG: hypothetical protein E6Q76_15215, partial [Rhizobium sp.]